MVYWFVTEYKFVNLNYDIYIYILSCKILLYGSDLSSQPNYVLDFANGDYILIL